MKKKHYYKYIKAKVRIDCHLVIQSLQTLKDEGINNGGVPINGDGYQVPWAYGYCPCEQYIWTSPQRLSY